MYKIHILYMAYFFFIIKKNNITKKLCVLIIMYFDTYKIYFLNWLI